jgi:hypothetical protein
MKYNEELWDKLFEVQEKINNVLRTIPAILDNKEIRDELIAARIHIAKA